MTGVARHRVEKVASGLDVRVEVRFAPVRELAVGDERYRRTVFHFVENAHKK